MESALVAGLEEAVELLIQIGVIIFLLGVIAFMLRFFADAWRHWGREDE